MFLVFTLLFCYDMNVSRQLKAMHFLKTFFSTKKNFLFCHKNRLNKPILLLDDTHRAFTIKLFTVVINTTPLQAVVLAP